MQGNFGNGKSHCIDGARRHFPAPFFFSEFVLLVRPSDGDREKAPF